MAVPPEKWGRDHLTTFMYLETRIVDYQGRIDARQMRGDGNAYETRLRDGDSVKGHNDWDCLHDCEEVGLAVNNGTGTNPVFTLTDLGWKFAGALRRYRAERGSINGFDVENWFLEEEHD